MENTKMSYGRKILASKLRDLKVSQESIENLSDWCVNYRSNANKIVEDWEQQLQSSSKEQYISLLYLANHILQSSRRNGPEFINEFWKVLPKALRKVYYDGEDEGRKKVLRLVKIWKDRKVFGSRSYILEEEVLTWEAKRNQSMKLISYELNRPRGEQLENILLSYKNFYSYQIDLDALSKKYQQTLEIIKLGDNNEEFKKQEAVVQLREYTGIIKEYNLRKASLLTNLTEALNEVQGIHDRRLDKLLEVFESLQIETKDLILHPSVKIDLVPKKKRSRELYPDAFPELYTRKEKSACRNHALDRRLVHASPTSPPMLPPPLPPFPPPLTPPPPTSPQLTSPSPSTPQPQPSEQTLSKPLPPFPPPLTPSLPASQPPASPSQPPALLLPPSLLPLTSPPPFVPPQPPTAPSFTPLARPTVEYALGHGSDQHLYPSFGIHLGLPLQGNFIQYPALQEVYSFDPLVHWIHPPT